MIIIKILTVVVICIFLLQKVWSIDKKDRTHPFGLDQKRNDKYAKNIEGEKYGVSVFWGRPKNKDKIKDRLNKIEWLSGNYTREVSWRRAICFGITGALFLPLMNDYQDILNFRRLSTTIILIGMLVYFSDAYYKHHILDCKKSYIQKHISVLKKQLDINTDNPIYNYI